MQCTLLCRPGRYCLLYPDSGAPAGLAGSRLPPRPQLLIDAYDKGNLLGAHEVSFWLVSIKHDLVTPCQTCQV
jgi:hypothetical protein